MSTTKLILALLAGACALPAAAKSFCCSDDNGRRVCGDILPPQCAGRAYRMTDDKGMVHQVEAPLTAEQKARKEADDARRKEEERVAAEQRRRDQALLNTYSTEKDIDVVRDRALADFDEAGKQVQEKLDIALKRKRKLEQEAEFYAKKPMPESLKSQMKENEVEIQAQQKSIADRSNDKAALNKKFDDEKQRYLELKYGKSGGAGASARPR